MLTRSIEIGAKVHVRGVLGRAPFWGKVTFVGVSELTGRFYQVQDADGFGWHRTPAELTEVRDDD